MFNLESALNNQQLADGSVGQLIVNGSEMQGMSWDPGLRRPYINDRGKLVVDVTRGFKPRRNAEGRLVTNQWGQPHYDRIVETQLVAERMAQGLPVLAVNNATALRKDQWIEIDAAVQQGVMPRLRAWADLRAASPLNGIDGMSTPIFEYESVTDAGEAVVDMDGLSEARNFAETYSLQGMPLPVTHSGFFISQRFNAVGSKRGQNPGVTRANDAGRRIGEAIEKTYIGTQTGITYGTSTDYEQTSKVYGLTNHPDRITKTDLTASASFAPETFYNEVLAMRELAYAQNFFGPFMLYVSTAYDALLDRLFKTATGNYPTNMTVRQQVRQIDGISDVRRLDYLTGDVLLLVQLTPNVVQAVNGMDITTVQWDTEGGMRMNFKVMAIQAALIRSSYVTDTSGPTTTKKTGIVHGTTS